MFRSSATIGNTTLLEEEMLELLPESSIACVVSLAQVCQVLAGEFLDSAQDRSDPRLLAGRFAGVPAPASYGEAVVAADLLARFTGSLGARVHLLFHRAGSPGICDFRAEKYGSSTHVASTLPLTWTGERAFGDWCDSYFEASDRFHSRTLTVRARHEIERDLSTAIATAGLARRLWCSGTVLERRFLEDAGETLVDYRTRLRVVAALGRLRTSDDKIDGISREVGWKSRKDLYRALFRFTRLTPAEIRALPESEASGLVERLMNRPGRPPTSRRLGTFLS